MNVSLYIAKRYLFAKSSNNAINIMSIIASGGVIVAASALFIVLSGFAGLKDFSLQFSSFADPDVKLLPLEGKSFMFSEEDMLSLKTIDGIEVCSRVIEEHVAVRSENKNLLATLKGVDQNFLKVTPLDSMVTSGSWIIPKSQQVVAGDIISNNLSFGIFDVLKPLTLYVAKPGRGQLSSASGAYNSINVTNVGIFSINETLNKEYIFSDIYLAKDLLNYSENQISALELKLDANANEISVREQINSIFKNRFLIKNRAQLNDELYKMLNTENLAVYLIFTLVIIIALFNVVGAIIMMILDKKQSLNTLFSLGAEPKTIKRVFFLQGSLMTVLSGVIGVALGIVIVLLQSQFDLVMLTPSLPYPVKFQFINIIVVLATIFFLGIVASRIASQRITKNLIKNS